MLMLGLQGSPRLKGNTNYLLSAFMEEARKFGVQTHVIQVCKKNIEPCKEYIVCEKKGFCPIDDDMKHEIYSLLREAEFVIAATPVFFYNTTAQLKALIDRSQTLWARRYKLKLVDPGSKTRRGVLLSVGATKGKNLFEGLHLTAKYFFDAINASYEGGLTYRQIEQPGDMEKHPGVDADIKNTVASLVKPLLGRPRVLVLGRENACRSQMASAFLQYQAGDKIEVLCAGTEPGEKIHPVMEKVMQEKGIDMAFRRPKGIQEVSTAEPPALIIDLDEKTGSDIYPGVERQVWHIPSALESSVEAMAEIRDKIEKKVGDIIQKF
ncbi:MAG: NAD(P)H-dependent oxidoreductase [Desulfobacterales bacterium]|nr:NAD(P)H-dependent oxidoreductase [Desulfobacterales bacterium]